MSPLEHLLHSVASSLDTDAVSRAQQQGPGMQVLLGMARESLRRAGGLQELLNVLLSQDVQGCCAVLEGAESLKAQGNTSFKHRQYEEAAQHYTDALRLVDELTDPGAALAAALYCNRALCFLRMSPPQPAWAQQDGSCAISCDPTSGKAWYRRACARQAAGDLPGALGDAQHALALQQQQQQQQAEGSSEVASLVEALQQQLRLQEVGRDTGQALAGGSARLRAPELPGGVGAGGAQRRSHQALNKAQDNGPWKAARPGGSLGGVQGASGGSAGAAADSGFGVATTGSQPAEVGPAAALARQRSDGALTVRWSAEGGRFLAASRELAAGADVLREAPFALALTRTGRKLCCHQCGKVMAAKGSQPPAAAWYCRACPLAQFCSTACRHEGSAPHRHQPRGPECGRPWTALLPPDAVLALRLARSLSQEEPLEARCLVASLEGHFAELEPAEAACLAASALVVHATWEGAQSQSEAAASAGGGTGRGGGPAGRAGEPCPTPQDLLRALCQVRINGIAVVPAARAGVADRLGLAMYPVASMMNHACRPNVSLHFEGVTAVLRTLEHTPAGAPLLHCYGPQQGEMAWQQRQSLLRSQYCFDCSCAGCAAGPSNADAELVGLRCPGCTAKMASPGGSSVGAVLPPASMPPGLVSHCELPPTGPGSSSCSNCGAALGAAEWERDWLPQLQQAAEYAARAEELVAAAELGSIGCEAEKAVELLGRCLKERQRLLHPHNQLIGMTHDALARALHAAQRPTAAVTHLHASLGILARLYPPTSTAVAFQQLQLAAMLRLAAAEGSSQAGAKAEELVHAALAVLALHFGPQEAAALAEGC